MRYSEWWYTEFPKQFKKRGFDVKVLGEGYIERSMNVPYDPAYFSPTKQAILLETLQIDEYMNLDIQDDDILFLADISFPGIFTNVLYHRECPKMYAFCHATSINKLDYFQSVSYSKFPVESSQSILFDTVFLGSKYHQAKLQAVDKRYWRNTLVTYLPFPPIFKSYIPIDKTIDIMSASRPSPQKVDLQLEDLVAEKFGKIYRPESKSWDEYQENLMKSKILLISALEDTFGFQIVDAVMNNNCIPLARRDLAYRELLPDEFLYSGKDELFKKIDYIVNRDFDLAPDVGVHTLLCKEQMDKFYDVICEEMRNG